MPTTGGALAFAGLVPPYEATLTKNLEAAGAIILAKTQLTELANWVTAGMPGNYNGLNGYGYNPWDPRRDPRDAFFDGRPVLSTGGSSSGAGTNVSFWAGNVGTETSGSILSPSNQNMLVGIKPTVGRVSRYGVIPITADQDTPGPMTKTVADAAIMLGAMEGARPDPNDPATTTCPPPAGRDYTRFLNPAGLRGARIGIPRAFFYEPTTAGSSRPRGGLSAEQRTAMDEAIAVLRAQGAIIVDPANIPSVVEPDSTKNFLNWGVCSGSDNAKGLDAGCSVAFKYGMKRDFNAWLQTLGNRAPVKTLTELRQWNIAHQRAGAIKYGQTNLDVSDEMDVAADRVRYETDRRKDILLSATNGIDAVMKANRLDALFFPGVSSANIAARTGYPSVTVPWALLPVPQGTGASAFPAGFTPAPAPYNVTFTGMACSEPKLIELAFAFEQATKKRHRPPLFP
jgi:amidase